MKTYDAFLIADELDDDDVIFTKEGVDDVWHTFFVYEHNETGLVIDADDYNELVEDKMIVKPELKRGSTMVIPFDTISKVIKKKGDRFYTIVLK